MIPEFLITVSKPQFRFRTRFCAATNAGFRFRSGTGVSVYRCQTFHASYQTAGLMLIRAERLAARARMPLRLFAALPPRSFSFFSASICGANTAIPSAFSTLPRRPLPRVKIFISPIRPAAIAASMFIPLSSRFWFLLTRRWKAVASTALSSAGFALLPGLLIGFARNIQYLRSALGGLGHFAGIDTGGAASTVSLTWGRSVSITSALGRLLGVWGVNSSHAFLLVPPVALIFLSLAWLLYRRHGIAMAPASLSRPHQLQPLPVA